jgi:hypothetical protein
MTYEEASRILNGMQENGLLSLSTKQEIRRIMVAYGCTRAEESTNNAIKIFAPGINAVEDRIEDGMQEAREVGAMPHPRHNPEAYEEWNNKSGNI